MKILSGLLMAVIILAACKTSDKKKSSEMSAEERRKDSLRMVENQKAMEDTANYTTIQWIDSTFKDMGKVNEGDVVNVAYRFKNTGDRPLVIANVNASCGCTIPEKPEEPIAPGAEGVIKASFNSNGQKELNRKNIYVDANTKPNRSHELTFEVTVNKKK